MIKIFQSLIVLVLGYILILFVLGIYYLFIYFKNSMKEDDLVQIDIQKWKDIQTKNSQLKKEAEILVIENKKMQKKNEEIILEFKQ